MAPPSPHQGRRAALNPRLRHAGTPVKTCEPCWAERAGRQDCPGESRVEKPRGDDSLRSFLAPTTLRQTNENLLPLDELPDVMSTVLNQA
jgi:hypothetical protein